MKKKKVLIISGIIMVLLVVAGWAVLRFGISFVFDKYVLETTLSSLVGEDIESIIRDAEISGGKEPGIIGEKGEEKKPMQSQSGDEIKQTPKQSQSDGEKSENSEKALSGGKKTAGGEGAGSSSVAGTKGKLTNAEIINKVMKSSSLTNKMASMVSYDDKKRVISIVLSNFSRSELSEIAKNVKGGSDAGYEAKMIAEAKSRLTGSQWQECLNIAYKYADQMRPYVE